MAQKLFGLLGYPVGHSASPAMMNAAFAVMQVDGVYVPFGVAPDQFRDAVMGLRVLGVGGFNVTIPHKRAAYELMNERTKEAQYVGAVNVIRFEQDGRLTGHNTDVSGWWTGLRGSLADDERLAVCRRAAMLGVGGAARAILAALCLFAPDIEVNLVARSVDKAEELARDFEIDNKDNIKVHPWDERHDTISGVDLVINTTPIGMWPHAEESPVEDVNCFRANQIVQDIVYRPLETKFMAEARSRGATVVDGLSMLVHQGAEAIQFWLGEKAPVQVMYDSALRFLQQP